MNQKARATVFGTAIALATMLFMLFVVVDSGLWRIVFGAISVLLIIKLIVALRAERSDVSDFEQSLRRLTSVDKIGSD